MPKNPIQEQEIIKLLKLNYEIEIHSIHCLPFGADMNAFVYKADAGSKSYVVKIKYGNHEETHIAKIRLLHDSGLKKILIPNVAVDGKLFKQFQDFKMIV